MNTTEVSGHATLVRWRDSESISNVFEHAFRIFPALQSQAAISIKRSRLCARYLHDHADVEIEWTRHLPDHLELDRDGKKLRVFELVSLLEIMKESSSDGGTDMPDALKRFVSASCISGA